MPQTPSFRYTRVRRMNEAGQGHVWLACDPEGVYYSMRVLSQDLFEDAQAYAQEIQDIEAFRPVSRTHEGLVGILASNENEPNSPFAYVMELADDASIAAPGMPGTVHNPDHYQPRTLQHEILRRGPLPTLECLEIALSLTRALGCLHEQGFVHPDTSSESVLFIGGSVKLGNIARKLDSPRAPAFNPTEGFLPPEGVGTVQSDLYSLGKVFYEMLTRHRASQFPLWPKFKDPAHSQTQRRLQEIVLKACAHDPQNRYLSCEELDRDLRAAQALPAPKGPGTKLVVAGATIAVAALALAAFLWLQHREPTAAATPAVSVAPAPAPVASPPPTRPPPTSPPPAQTIASPNPAPEPAPPPAHAPACRVVKVLFADALDTDTSANWTVRKTSDDTAAVFASDYSDMGIPPAPGSSQTLGLRLSANMSLPKSREAICLSPAGQRFTGSYRLKFQLWMNTIGPFPEGGPESTQYFMAGVGTAGEVVHWSKNPDVTEDGIWFVTNGDGDRLGLTAHRGAAQFNAGVYLAGSDTTARNCTNAYYASTLPGGHVPPVIQAARYPSQVGATKSGCLGLSWHTIEILKLDRKVYWSIDGLLIAAVSLDDQPFHDNIFLGFVDDFPGVAAHPELCFALVANLTVEEVAADQP